MLTELKWENLETRRKTAGLSFMNKLSHERTDIPAENYLKPNGERRTRSNHLLKYRVPQANKDTFKLSFFPRTIRE